MRKILYSPGYGAGWTTWHDGPREEKLFMLEYQPFIDAIERGEVILPDDLKYMSEEKIIQIPLIAQFVTDWNTRFGSASLPYFGGLSNLAIEEVDGRVKLSEYDGFESIEFEVNSDSWL